MRRVWGGGGRQREAAAGAYRRALLGGVATAALMVPGLAAAQDSGGVPLPEIKVVPTTPVAPPIRRAPAARSSGAPRAAPAPAQTAAAQPGVVELDKIPSNAQSVPADAFSYTTTAEFLQAMERSLPGVSIGNQTGNEFQRDINYRGFVAGPVIGTPQGLAIYQNGVRINEVFGDVVNWDLIPEKAINGMTLVPSNPVYGLNAIGGAISMQMKNGFTYHNAEAEVNGGSYGRFGTSVQAGGEVGNLSGYFAADAINDAGWRMNTPSSLRRVYADVGARGDQTEFHLSFTGANNSFSANPATPVQMLAQNWTSTYTLPQTTQNQLAFLTASATWKPSDTWTYQAVAYFRNFQQTHVDGNPTNAQNSGCPNPTVLCYPNLDGTLMNLITTTGQTVPATGALGTSFLAEIDRTWTTTNSFGGSAQVASSEKIWGHGNNFVIGVSVDRGLVQFAETSELGTLNANQFPFAQGFGLFINQPSGDNAPVGLGATTLYTGIYATDTFDVTSQLSVTAGGRFNFAQINLTDQLGDAPLLNGNHTYTHFNPMIGATYKLTPNLTVYGDFSVANRAPTPLELECADPTKPCLIDNALVGDPNLQQVVTYTFEGGLRGHFAIGSGQGNWTLGAYRALNTNDIISVASPIIGHVFFQNAGDTLRQGVEANLNYTWDRWNFYSNFTYVDATFRNALTLGSPFNPFADANGNIFVVPGDHLPGIPNFRFKAGAEYQITKPWKFGADLVVIGSQWLVGDDSNQNPKIPASWVVNLHSSYKITDNFEVFGLVRNVFDRHYYVLGTFFDVTSYPYLGLTDPRTFVPGMPFAAYIGLRGTMPTTGGAVSPVITKAPSSVLSPSAVNWTGVYLGVNAGYGFGASAWKDNVTGGSTGNFGVSGFLAGGTLGANYQVGSVVFGIEGDGAWADMFGRGTVTASALCLGGCLTANNWLATLRGRVGYAFDRYLVYGTAGAALGNIAASYSTHSISNNIEAGWTVGAGIEGSFARNWTAKFEYLFVDLANGSCTTDCAIANANGPALIPNIAVKFNESIVRAGVSYKFGL